MIRIAALAGANELRWLRETVADLTLRHAWQNCELHGTGEADAWDGRLAADAPADIIICDITGRGTPSSLRSARKLYPRALVIPIVSETVPPSAYVQPDILPFALLWKPLGGDENAYVLFRALSQAYAGEEAAACFSMKSKKETRRIPYSDICYFEARDKKIHIRLPGQELCFYETLEHLEQTLPEFFLRCHKSYLINRRHIEKVDWSGPAIYLTGQVSVPLSRGYRSRVREALHGAY